MKSEKNNENVNDWIGGADFSQEEKKANTYTEYVKKYNQKFKKVNVHKKIYEKFQQFVSQQYRLSFGDAISCLILDFLEKENPSATLEQIKHKFERTLNNLSKKSGVNQQ